MCGIAGLASREIAPQELRARALRMAELQVHRGPDHGSVMLFHEPWSETATALASRRLAILDLSPAGHQPMGNEDGSVWVVFNGEISNFAALRTELQSARHCFRSNADTEVLVHGYEQWGMRGLLERIQGMFSFAVWDKRRARLSLARDRFGKKPVYYFFDGRSLAFASELSALRGSGLIGAALSPAATVAFLQLGSVPAPLAILKDARALEPAHFLVFEHGRLSLERYWDLQFSENTAIGAAEAAERTLALMRQAVKSRLLSDVPVGVFLSGGIDSTALVALARQATSGRLGTHSVIFNEAEFNEAGFAEQVARCFGTEHTATVHTATVLSANDLRAELPAVIAAMDQPTVDGVNTYFISKLARAAGTVVALSGIGGDEVFGGYATFRRIPQMVRIAKILGPAGRAAALLARGVQRSRPGWPADRIAEFLRSPGSIEDAYLAARGLFSADEIRRLIDPDFAQAGLRAFDAVSYLASARGPVQPVENAVSSLELKVYLHNQLLRDSDVMSMAHSLELRAPILDRDLVEFIASVPVSIKFAGRQKGLMLRALDSIFPREIATRPRKQGFTLPFERWLKGECRAAAEEILFNAGAAEIMRKDAIHILWNDFLAGRIRWWRGWALMVLNGWMAQARAAVPAEARGAECSLSQGDRRPGESLNAQRVVLRDGRNDRSSPSGIAVTQRHDNKLLLGVFTQLTGHGGIPYAGRQAAAVLSAAARARGMKCRILGLNDPAHPDPIRFASATIPFAGFEGNKFRLAAAVLAAEARLELAYFGHCSLAPLALPLGIGFGGRFVVAGHGVEIWRRLPALERLALRRAMIVTAPSEYTANEIVRRNRISARRVAIVPWGLDSAFAEKIMRIRERPPLPSGPILLTVSRLDASDRYKGVDSVIRAMPAILRMVADAHYVIVGDGDDRRRLQALAAELGMAARVHFTGAGTDDEVAAYYVASDIFVMPSRKEGLGLVFVEAMACGKPVVAADACAAPEVVRDGETGFLVGYGNVDALADRVARLCADEDLRRRMGAAGQRRFEQNYTFDRFRDSLEGLLFDPAFSKRSPRLGAIELSA